MNQIDRASRPVPRLDGFHMVSRVAFPLSLGGSRGSNQNWAAAAVGWCLPLALQQWINISESML